MPTSARWEVANSPKIPVKYGASCRVDVGIDELKGSLWCVRNFGLLQVLREKSRKTEGVFLVGSRRPGGKSKSLRARFLLEKQKKMLKGSCKFPIRVLTLLCVSLTTKTVRIRRRTFNYRCCLLQPLRRFAPAPLVPKGNLCWILCQPYAPT